MFILIALDLSIKKSAGKKPQDCLVGCFDLQNYFNYRGAYCIEKAYEPPPWQIHSNYIKDLDPLAVLYLDN